MLMNGMRYINNMNFIKSNRNNNLERNNKFMNNNLSINIDNNKKFRPVSYTASHNQK